MKPPATAKRGNQPKGAPVSKPGARQSPAATPSSPGPEDNDVSHPTPASGSPEPAGVPSPMFGSALEPVLLQACHGRLSSVSWFRTDWQRGGALTGYAAWQDENGSEHEAVVKMPVPPRERAWLVRLSESAAPGDADRATPRVFAHGDALNGYDLAWVVMERLPHGPLGPAWQGREFDLMVDAAARFYAAADTTALPDEAPPEHRDWEGLLRLGRDKVRDKSWPGGQAWKKALKQASKHLDAWLDVWWQRPRTGWVHGDLHLGNAMSRTAPEPAAGDAAASPKGAVLLDLAHVRPGHWVEDAVYCEHLYWSVPQRLGGRKLASQLAKARRAKGLPVGDDWAELADVKRKLLAMATPATPAHHGGGQPQLDAALARLV